MNNIKKLLGQRIKELRKNRKYTQEQLAEILDIDQRTLSAIECGINFPTKNFIKIANTFNISLIDLFDFERIELNSEQKKMKICSLLNELSSRDLDILYKLIKLMIQI